MSSYDLAAFQGIAAGNTLGSTNPLRQSLLGADGKAMGLAGPLKALYQFVHELFTPVGVPFEATSGVPFYQAAVSGAYRTQADVLIGFAEAKATIFDRWVRDSFQDDLPPAERLADAVLESVGLGNGQLTLTIAGRTEDDSAAVLQLPVSLIQ